VGRQRGVALALVLWFLAGMSVLVAGIVLNARNDTQLAQVHINEARVAAAGDGAIRLLLADRRAAAAGGARSLPWQGSYRLGDLVVSVAALPVPLLIDVNRADASLLRRGLLTAGAVAEADAGLLAGAIVQWRPPGPRAGAGQRRFETLEDLLQVEGFSRSSWETARDYLSARREAAGQREDSAPAARLLTLVSALAPAARAGQPELLAALPPDALPSSASSVMRVDALVRLDDRVWLRRCWVDGSAEGPDLPWEMLRREPARVVAVARRAVPQ